MSLHIDETECHMQDGHTVWVAKCACGYSGEPRPAGEHKTARRDYRQHVEGELGPLAYFAAPVACRNCGSRHEQGILMGTHVSSENCAHCGTTMLSPDNSAWKDSKRNQQRWAT